VTATASSVSGIEELTMPKLSDSMEEATILAWLVEVGTSFSRGQSLFEVETDKATVVYEAEADGTLVDILVAEGGTAPLGAPVARVATAGTAVEAKRTNATPVARSLAKSLSIDLARLSGSGPGGRIVRRDVLAAAPQPAQVTTIADEAVPDGEVRVDLSSAQRTIVRRMIESRSSIPDFTLAAEIDVTSALALRRQLNEAFPDARVSVNDLVVKASGVALREFPRLNASYDTGSIIEHHRVDVGVAVDVGDLLLVPVLRAADTMPLFQLASASRDLAVRARERRLSPAELEGGTFTVSNLGMLGVTSFHAVINPPQAAILAVGSVERRPVFDDDDCVVAAEIATLTLSCDHRVVNGAEAARFLNRIRELLGQPLLLFGDALTIRKESTR
jgi:pyruvate dehydrogenase E2 component (dihydrolipoamide acetyltransferase)